MWVVDVITELILLDHDKLQWNMVLDWGQMEVEFWVLWGSSES